MISAIINGKTSFLFQWQPDWGSGVEVGIEKLTSGLSSLTLREERVPLASKLRWSMRFTAQLNATESAQVRAALDAWDNRQIVVPFWPAERKHTQPNTASVIGSLNLFYQPDWSEWEVASTSNPTSFAHDDSTRRVPVLIGRFEELPTSIVTDAHGNEEWSVSVVENTDVALTINTLSLTLGATIHGQNPPVLTVPFIWGSNTVAPDVRVERKKIGFGRLDADTYYPHTPRRQHRVSFEMLNSEELRQLFTLFDNRYGSVKPWYLPRPHGAAGTSDRLFGRFFSDRLTITWFRSAMDDEMGQGDIEFITLPTEQSVPFGETFGGTLGPLDTPWYGYEVTDGYTVWRFTSYETTVNGPGGFYSPRSMTHGRIVDEINLQVSDCPLDIQHWAENPFLRLLRQPTAAPLKVTVYEGKLADGINATDTEIVYCGYAKRPRIRGHQMEVQLRGIAAGLLKLNGPKSTLQTGCGAVLGDAKCGVDIGDFSFVGEVVSFADGIVRLSISGDMPADGYFANGSGEPVSPSTPPRNFIHDSYEEDGLLVLVLGAVATVSVGQTWNIYPGCDGQYSTCKNVFENEINHTGCPNLPSTNPSMIVLPQNQRSGKK